MTTSVSPSRTAAVQQFLAALDRLVDREARSDPDRLGEQAEKIRLSVGLLVAGFLVAFGPMPVPLAAGSVLGAVLMVVAAMAGIAALVDR